MPCSARMRESGVPIAMSKKAMDGFILTIEKRKREPAVSRVLSRTIIHLGQPSPTASSNLPGSPLRHAVQALKPAYSPIWSCSRRGLPCRDVLPRARCALTAPFHPYRRQALRRYVFCGTFHGFTPSRRYLAPCLVEPGLSSGFLQIRRLPGRLSLSQAAVYCIAGSPAHQSESLSAVSASIWRYRSFLP